MASSQDGQPPDLNETLRAMILANSASPATRFDHVSSAQQSDKRASQQPTRAKPQQKQALLNPQTSPHTATQSAPQHQRPRNDQKKPNTPNTPRVIQHPHQKSQENNSPRHDQSRNFRAGPHSGHRSRPSQFSPAQRAAPASPSEIRAASHYLQATAETALPQMEMGPEELTYKDDFRNILERNCQEAASLHYQPSIPIRLVAFGSLASGFGMPGSDMDLALLAPQVPTDMPRLLERKMLDLGIGARLLTRTRVPILKLCERPSSELYKALCEERQKWDEMTPEERAIHDTAGRHENPQPKADNGASDTPANVAREPEFESDINGTPKEAAEHIEAVPHASQSNTAGNTGDQVEATAHPLDDGALTAGEKGATSNPSGAVESNPRSAGQGSGPQTPRPSRKEKQWYREKPAGPLDFPKDSSCGIQCDINFSSPLGIHNTQLLRCYSTCDFRVRYMVIFIKAWASRRKINSGYNGTLSSYGYVLMVLHYLVNVVQPFVCPNLQLSAVRKRGASWQPDINDPKQYCEGYDVRFWRNESEIAGLAAKGMLTHNRDPLGVLLWGFFAYYGQQGYTAPGGGFAWTQHVLSLRSPTGLLTKQAKGWTGAKTTDTDGREVRHRYLMAIEDPFETDHNVARTVTHHGICAIRDEFRRACRILADVGKGREPVDGDLLERVVETAPAKPTEEGKADATGDTSAENVLVQADTDAVDAARHGEGGESNGPT